MTPLQLKTLHAALGRLTRHRPDAYGRAWLDLAMRNVGAEPDGDGRVSSKSLTNRQLEDVMALIEQAQDDEGFRPGSYWRDTVARRRGLASRPQARALRRLAALTRYDLAALCRRVSDGAAVCPERLTPRQAYQLTEALKDITARDTAGGQSPGANHQ